MKTRLIYITLILMGSMMLAGCDTSFLDVKPDKKYVIPNKLKDLQALMDNTVIMNSSSSLSLAEMGTDNLSLMDNAWSLLAVPAEKNAYIWSPEIYETQPGRDWDMAYQRILYTNITLEGLDRLKPSAADQPLWNAVKGAALFQRGWSFFQLAQLFCDLYDPASSNTGPGIPLRLESDINLPAHRASIVQTYQQIINDLKSSAELLPENTIAKERPCKQAAYGMLARLYLQMGDYPQALSYANLYLGQPHKILDYNTLNLTARYTFPTMGRTNDEVVFVDNIGALAIFSASRMFVSDELYGLYPVGDLRKQAYYIPVNNILTFKGSYSGGSSFFAGIASNEIYLVRAECSARSGDVAKAYEDLNTLLKNRWNPALFIPYSGGDAQRALETVLLERRKELAFKGLRWSDLRRLNRDARFAKTLKRKVGDQEYQLSPNDPRYTFPIPDNVISYSGMSQNPR